MTADQSTRQPNRLRQERSPYLLQHAYNPVDWFPWGAEAFQKARQEDKPIFLSIGYSTCHWCHVMERESFENEDVAQVMNEHFVCIKVDREERPDIDKIYMTAVQATTGSGGWPMSVWLTPQLKPFFCGTYFPAERFVALLNRVHDVWEANRDAVVKQAGDITATLAQHAALPAGRDAQLDDAPLRLGIEQFRAAYDSVHGGFGGAPKFPRPVVFNFLFRAGGGDMALHTLRNMGDGGLFDQLGGGFHRYSVDERWLVSHFEKMLYDQAQLVVSYCEAYQITREPFFADIARRTCDYVLRDLTSPSGGFYSAEDADSEGVEGKFYVWTKQEVEAVLGDQADLFCRAYDVDTPGNWEHGMNVLHVAMHPLPDLEECRQKLFAAREKRVRPHRDEKILTGWNGLMISALSKAAQVLAQPRYRQAAARAAAFILAQHTRDGTLLRTATVPAVLDDHACFATGLLDLYETDFDSRWLAEARRLADQMIALFSDGAAGGFFMTDGRDPSVIVRAKEDYDGAEPSGNSVATLLLLRLAALTESDRDRQLADRTLAAFHAHLTGAPHAVPQMLCALDFARSTPLQIVLAGERDAADTQALRQVVHERFLPNKVLLLAADGGAFARQLKPVDGRVTAYVCENFACRLPTNDPRQLANLLQ